MDLRAAERPLFWSDDCAASRSLLPCYHTFSWSALYPLSSHRILVKPMPSYIQHSYPSHSTCLCNMYPTLSLAFVSYSISSLRILLHNQLSYPSLYLAVISISIHMPLYPALSPAFVSCSIPSRLRILFYIQLSYPSLYPANIKQVSSPF